MFALNRQADLECFNVIGKAFTVFLTIPKAHATSFALAASAFLEMPAHSLLADDHDQVANCNFRSHYSFVFNKDANLCLFVFSFKFNYFLLFIKILKFPHLFSCLNQLR